MNAAAARFKPQYSSGNALSFATCLWASVKGRQAAEESPGSVRATDVRTLAARSTQEF